MQNLKPMTLGRTTYKVNKDIGYFPYFSLTLRQRIKKKLSCNIGVVGEAGIGKSYTAWTYALALDKHFTVDQIVYTYADYMRLIRHLPMGRHIVFDEPSYAMSKQDWFKELDKVLVKTMESQRFKVHPIWLPVINITLLNKTVREHLIQFLVIVLNRGYARVYRLYHSHWEDNKFYHPFFCTLKFPLVGACPRDSCLGCKKLKTCGEFRAKYERKKASIQEIRYEQAEHEADKIESEQLTDSQIEKIVYQELKDKILNEKGSIDARLIRVVLLREKRVKIGYNKAYTIKKLLEYDYPEEFNKE